MTFLAAGLAMALAAISPNQSQSGDGSIAGVIADPSGRALEGALVVLATDSADGQRRVFATDVNGRYRFDPLPAGDYRLEVRMPGFLTKPGLIRLEPGARVDWSGALLLGTRADDRTVERDLVLFTGRDAVDCGRHLGAMISHTALLQSLDCGLSAARLHRPFSFVVQHSKSGTWEFEGLTAASDGQIHLFTYSDASRNFQVRPCAEPVVARDSVESGRRLGVTCTARGTITARIEK